MSQSRCTGCGETFGGVTSFDAHHKWSDTHPFITCMSPAEVGLVITSRGVWGQPTDEGLEKLSNKSGYVPASERPASDFHVECRDCGTIFERPRTRGRPPTRCAKCKETQ